MATARNPFFPFHALGFRCNPFRALTDEEWAEMALLPPAVTDALPVDGPLQIVGEMGSGKTSVLLALWKHFQEAGRNAVYEYLPAGTTTFRTDLRSPDVFLLDEAQRLNRRARRRLATAAESPVRLIFSSHEDLSPLFEGAGVRLTTVRLTTPSPARLRRMLHRRLACFALRPGALPPLGDDALDALLHACGGNLRAMERALYEAFQGWAAAGSMPPVITAAALKPFLEQEDG